ncbi:MAG: PspC domain-containing protein [candidate division Zixibacteria bacterium]|nr:PspC domain-containing protein [candidate division Zixibacteria bacterium]
MKRLYKSRTDRKIAGVCGGLAEYMDVDSTVIRLGTLLVMLMTAIFPMVIVYIIGCIIIPDAPPGSRVETGPLT